MKTDWQTKTLGEIATIIAGQSPPGDSYNSVGNGTPFYQGKKDYGDRYLLPPTVWTTEETKIAEANDLLISVRAPVGALNFATQRVCIGRGLAAIRTDKVLPDFLYYALSHLSATITGKDGVVFASITKKDIEKIVVPILSIDEQQRIVGILDAAFEKIDKVQRNAERNLVDAKELFQRILDEEMTPKEGVEITYLNKIYNFIDYRGKTPNKINKGVVLITAKNIKFGYIDYSFSEYISRDEFATRKSRGIAQKGDILFTTEAPLGNVAIADIQEYSTGQRIITFQQYQNSPIQINNAFYCYYFQSTFFQNILKVNATGETVLGIKASVLKKMPVPIVAINKQNLLVKKLDDACRCVKDLNRTYLNCLNNIGFLKQQILSKAFNGEL